METLAVVFHLQKGLMKIVLKPLEWKMTGSYRTRTPNSKRCKLGSQNIDEAQIFLFHITHRQFVRKNFDEVFSTDAIIIDDRNNNRFRLRHRDDLRARANFAITTMLSLVSILPTLLDLDNLHLVLLYCRLRRKRSPVAGKCLILGKMSDFWGKVRFLGKSKRFSYFANYLKPTEAPMSAYCSWPSLQPILWLNSKK